MQKQKRKLGNRLFERFAEMVELVSKFLFFMPNEKKNKIKCDLVWHVPYISTIRLLYTELNITWVLNLNLNVNWIFIFNFVFCLLTSNAIFGKMNKSSSLLPIERSSSQIKGCFGIVDTVPLSLNTTSPWDNSSLDFSIDESYDENWIKDEIKEKKNRKNTMSNFRGKNNNNNNN